MKDWFEWKGQKCTDYGIHVLEQPSVTFPKERAKFTDVPGRSGSIVLLEGETVYDDLSLTAECFVHDLSRLQELGQYLRGSSRVIFANRPDGFYEGRIVNQIPFEQILRGNPDCTFPVNFRCKPFRYLIDSPSIELTQSMQFVHNPGSVYSQPIIDVYGTGEITLMVGQQITELAGVNGKITLNSVLQEAYDETSSQNMNMSGDFPLLREGGTPISWTGDVVKVVIELNWRCLA